MSQNFLRTLPEGDRAEFIAGIFDLVRTGRRDALCEMLDSGVPVDLTNDKGDSLLIIAAYSQEPLIVGDLLERRARTDTVNAMGQTAISCAVFRNDQEILNQLLASGANPDLGARTAMEIAEQFELAAMVQVLKSHPTNQ